MVSTFRFADADGEPREYSPSAEDIARWRSRFPGLDVEKQLESLAGWTFDKWRQKSKRRKLSGAHVWITNMLKRAHDRNEGFGHLSRAREELAKPIWVRRGMTEREWNEEQDRLFWEKQQEQMELQASVVVPPAVLELKSELAALIAQQPEMEFETPPSRQEQERCRHEMRPHHFYLATHYCLKCGVTTYDLQFAWSV